MPSVNQKYSGDKFTVWQRSGVNNICFTLLTIDRYPSFVPLQSSASRMSNFIDDDDLHDYANEEYDDDLNDEITPEDDEKINQLIPEVKKELSDYTGFDYDDMYNELWECYLDVSETVKNLKSMLFCSESTPINPPVILTTSEFQKDSRRSLVLKPRLKVCLI